MKLRLSKPLLFWTASALWLPLAGAVAAWTEAGDDLSPIVEILFLLPLLFALAVVLTALGGRAFVRGRAPFWLPAVLIFAEAALWIAGGPLWTHWGRAMALAEARADLQPTVAELEAGRPPSRGFGGPEVLERGPPLRVTLKAGWHRFTYDGGDRPVPGCDRVAPRWSACPLWWPDRLR